MSKLLDKKIGETSLNEELLIAVRNGNFHTVKKAITSGANINSCNSAGQSLLIIALAFDKIDIANYLLSKNECDVNVTDFRGETALHFSLKDSISCELMEKIIVRGADLEATNIMGHTPLSKVSGDISKTDKLIRAGANIFKKHNFKNKVTGPLLNKYFLFFTAISRAILNSNIEDKNELISLFESEVQYLESRSSEDFMHYLKTIKIPNDEKQLILKLCTAPISLTTIINVPLDEDGNRLGHKLLDRGNWDLFSSLCENYGLEINHKNNKGISCANMFNLEFNAVDQIASIMPLLASPGDEISLARKILSYLDVADICNLAVAIPPSTVRPRSSSRLIAFEKEALR